jgi:epoxyqueuosine reductase QueG
MAASSPASIKREMRQLADSMGATIFGVADVSRAFAVWPASFKESGRLLTGISIGVAENDNQLDNLPQTDDHYRTSHYNVNMALALRIGDAMAKRLTEHGYQAHRLSHPPVIAPTGLYKLVARYSGLGWIGKNRLLITRARGPRVALAAVLTDAPLPSTAKEPLANQCGDCTRCIDVCPVKAFSTAPFGETDSLKGFNTGRCAINRGTINPTGWGGCGLCMRVCPYGQRKGNLLEETVKKAALRSDSP